MVALRSHFSDTYAKCGGAIVTHRHVITAAHCLVNMYGDLQPFDPDKVHVYAGVHNNWKRKLSLILNKKILIFF